MPEPITWGQLPKSQIDPEKIEEAIARMIKEHNEDESAHLGPGQSLQSHKASEIIDHAVKSILAEKLHPSAQVAQCVVAPEGGDFTSISAALNAGYKRIYVKAATYTINSPIVISSDHILIEAEKGATLFLAPNVNDSVIIIDGRPAGGITDIVIRNLAIHGNFTKQTKGHGIYANSVTNLVIQNCDISQCKEAGIYLIDCSSCSILSSSISHCGIGLFITYDQAESWYHLVANSSFSSCSGPNLYLEGCEVSSFLNNVFDWTSNSNTDNIFIDSGSEWNIFIGNLVLSAQRDGFRIAGDENIIIGNFCRWNKGYGINILSGAIRNLVRLNFLIYNSAGSMLDNGTDTRKAASTTNDNIV